MLKMKVTVFLIMILSIGKKRHNPHDRLGGGMALIISHMCM